MSEILNPVNAQKIEIEIDPITAQALKVQEIDKKIAEAEANVADLKKQRAAYIYDSNVQLIINRAKMPQSPK